MKIHVLHSNLKELTAPSLLIPVFEDENHFNPFAASLNHLLHGQLSTLAESGEIPGRFGEFLVFRPENFHISRLIFVGVGKRKEFSLDRLRSAAAKAAQSARALRASALAVPVGHSVSLDPETSAQAVVEGAMLGLYEFRKYKNEPPPVKGNFPAEIHLIVENAREIAAAKKGGESGRIIGEAVIFTKNLVNEPSNVMTPSAFAEEAQKISKSLKLGIEILDETQIRKLGMGAFLSVAQGSKEKPKLIVIQYRGGSKQSLTLGLVGKGVTFDSGGISIKPSENMHLMVDDMAGAAACLGAVKAIAELRIPLNVIAVLPLAENLPDGGSYKPGDIVKSYLGKTIEVINTDAEGRLLLCDALAYICTMNVDAVVDLATLTGGMGIALGSAAAGLFSTHERLLQTLLKVGDEVTEPLWHLPLFPHYTLQVKGTFADLKNSSGRQASPCSAAAFLREFVGDTPWAHLDIASMAFIDSDKIPLKQRLYLPKSGATGVGVRTLTALAERLSKRKNL